jgi:transcriptional regulator with XRE-family HTH domain
MDTSVHTGATPERPYRIYNAASLGVALRDARQSAGMTQLEMAERLGVDRSYVSEMENGKETEQLRRVLSALRILGMRMTLRHESW